MSSCVLGSTHAEETKQFQDDYLDLPVDSFVLLASERRQEIWFCMALFFVYGAWLPYARVQNLHMLRPVELTSKLRSLYNVPIIRFIIINKYRPIGKAKLSHQLRLMVRGRPSCIVRRAELSSSSVILPCDS